MKNKGLFLILICMLIFGDCGKTSAKKDYPAAIKVKDVIYYSTDELLKKGAYHV